MENINDYSKKQADMCIDNDSIPKALYTDYGVKKKNNPITPGNTTTFN